ncbi:LysR family transcriptional regulator [Amycolatopsis alkalitolerans]|uniref:LysR family transcriptional regulator n=1 Tax=Amycolatopsis alkalitolerans TaxID=2547244 RepID=A0A5C4LS60_9PSEU|nr:LysR family transcriptional regulator [Amycolatopsis alkalitolerans]TNC18855.1 LysR family transcriptional regulator [Amycolatopsis alkalitolerans]
MLDVRRLRLLHEFAARGSIAATAAALGYTPSAVSQQLTTLEAEAGVALLERSARRASLTDAGQTLAAHARVVLDAIEAAEADLAVGGEPAGSLVVGMIPTASPLFAPALAGLRRRYPGLELVVRQIESARAEAALRQREIDVAVIDLWRERAMPGLTSVRLRRDPLVLAFPAGHPGRRVDGEVLLCAPADQPSRAATDELLGAAKPAARWEFEGLHTIATLVSQGIGVAVLPESALAEVDPATVTMRPFRPARHRWIEAVVRVSARRRPAVDAVLEMLTESHRRGGDEF